MSGLQLQTRLSGIPAVELRQEITFFVTTERALAAAGTRPVTTWSFELTPGAGLKVPVLIDVSVMAIGQRADLQARIVDIDVRQAVLDALPDGLGALATQIRRRLFPAEQLRRRSDRWRHERSLSTCHR